MARPHFSIVSAMVALSASFASFARAVERFATALVELILSIVPANPPIAFVGGLGATSAPRLGSIDPALYQTNRHEASVSRRSSDRNI